MTSTNRTKIYVASSWRNEQQPSVVHRLRLIGYEVYDFKDPKDNGDTGFHWSDIDVDWQNWSPERFRDSLKHPIAKKGFKSDEDAMKWADTCVLVLPCGRSAHLEGGHFSGHPDKRLHILLSDGEPELMYGLANGVHVNMEELTFALSNETLLE